MKTQKAAFCTRHLDGVPQKTLMAAGLRANSREAQKAFWGGRRFSLSITETAQLNIQVKPHCREMIPK